MEDPWGKIDDLLHNDEYRARLISLFSFQSGQKIKVLSIATSIIACGGLEYDRLKESEQSIEGDAKDPTGTAGPFKVGGKVYRVKHSTLKGKYKSNIVFMMSYRRIRYERRLPNAPTAGWFWQKAYGQRQKSIDEQARSFQAAGQAGIDGEKDVFWIDTHETQKGDVPAWIGDESVSSFAMVETGRRLSEEPTALFENASLVDTTAGAEEEESGREQLPDGFFSSDDEELNT
jgi:hypothetical protein